MSKEFSVKVDILNIVGSIVAIILSLKVHHEVYRALKKHVELDLQSDS